MRSETITQRDDLVIRRLVLEPGEAMPWHVDACRRFSVIVRGERLQRVRVEELTGRRARLQQSVGVQQQPVARLQPAPGGPSTEEIIAGVERGIFVGGDKSWSIDMQRYNFQFTGQRFYRIENGRLAGQLRDVAYQATTTEFWGSMEAVGSPETWILGGAFNCGKAQPGQVASVSHGCPTSLFRGVRILNTTDEAGH